VNVLSVPKDKTKSANPATINPTLSRGRDYDVVSDVEVEDTGTEGRELSQHRQCKPQMF